MPDGDSAASLTDGSFVGDVWPEGMGAEFWQVNSALCHLENCLGLIQSCDCFLEGWLVG